MYINRTIKCLKRLQKRSIDDNLRQLVLIRQDRVLVNYSTCFFTSDSFFVFLTFPKKWVGRVMENETFYGDGHIVSQLGIANALFSVGETRAKKVVCSRRLGHSLGRHI